MAKRTIVWHTKAYQRYSGIISWYGMNCGISFAESFIKDIDRELNILACMPTIGKEFRAIGGKHYAEFVSHPKIKIRYWFDENQLHIVDFKPTMTN